MNTLQEQIIFFAKAFATRLPTYLFDSPLIGQLQQEFQALVVDAVLDNMTGLGTHSHF